MDDEPFGGDDVTTDGTDSIVVELPLDTVNPAEELGDDGGGEVDDRRRQAEHLEGQSHLVAVAYTAMVDAVVGNRFERLATLVERRPSSVHLRTLLAGILAEVTTVLARARFSLTSCRIIHFKYYLNNRHICY
ncbi:hypothetical protein [Natrinema longum]|uniref:hypothetical protein n=1 Tax=Natrinema longum TaxID=370324 RepID=UPI001CCD736E|nr:hypothetical protein [Natrinema longum]MBZ6497007.1 hypothetical protein [Natrinema longum]